MVAEGHGVKVIHGASDGEFDVAGYPLTRLRSSLVDAFNIPDDAIALANGRRVTLDYIAETRDVIEFIRERGVKGGRKRTAATPDDGDDEQPVPDLSAMNLDGLAAFIDGRLASSHAAEQRSLLQAHKSAVALFWAGAALSEARAKCEMEGRGRWKAFKEEHRFKHSTVNDAILLFQNAKTPVALTGMGITEAKEKFLNRTPKQSGQSMQRSASGGCPQRQTMNDDEMEHGTESESDVVPSSEAGSLPPPREPDTRLNRLVKVVRFLEYQAQDLDVIDWRKESPDSYRHAIDQAMRVLQAIRDQLPEESSRG